MIRYVFLIAVMCLPTGVDAMAQSPGEQTFPNDEAWEWLLAPVPIDLSKALPATGALEERPHVLGFLGELFDGPDSATPFATLTTFLDTLPMALVRHKRGDDELRLVGFDALRNRFPFESRASAGMDFASVSMKQADVSPSDLKFVGVERLTAQSVKRRGVERAAKLRERGVNLPVAVQGQPYDFSFPLEDGKRVSLEDVKGKVVLIPWWASW